MPALLPNLATQLNDLAVANADGLLNDDEYRLLRQNLFERYSGGVEIVRTVVRKHVELVEQPSPRAPVMTPTRKGSGVAGFLRRATGWKSPAPTNAITLSLPRLFSKKPESPSLSDTDSSVTRSSSFSRKGSTGDLPSKPPPRPKDPTSPTRANFDAPLASPSRSAASVNAPQSKYDVIPGASNDIYDDDNLQTSEAIRSAIAAVEAEARRLVAAFNDLETSAVIRYRQEHPAGLARRPSASPLPTPSSSSHAIARSGSRSNSQTPAADALSVRSGNSLRTSRSTASLFHSTAPPSAFSQSTPPPPASGWTALSPRRLPSLRRKISASSIASQGTQGTPANSSLLGVRAASASLSRASSMSRSAGHLPLPLPVPVTQGSDSTMMELLNSAPPGEGGAELAEVRRRRAEMTGRCEARLEYLRAKLKGAQLREKLLRK